MFYKVFDRHTPRCRKCYNKHREKKRTQRFYSDPEYRARRQAQTRRYIGSQKSKDREKLKYLTDAKFRTRKRAMARVKYHVGVGNIKKLPCEICGNKKTHAHHCDYNYPLNVKWLCEKHHIEWHDNNTPTY